MKMKMAIAALAVCTCCGYGTRAEATNPLSIAHKLLKSDRLGCEPGDHWESKPIFGSELAGKVVDKFIIHHGQCVPDKPTKND